MSKPDDRLLTLLRSCALFANLSDKALAPLLGRAAVRKFAKGVVIYRRGEPGSSLMIIASGRIKIANVSPEGKEVVLNFLRAGDVSGEIAVLDEGERTADAVALEPTEALVISSRDLLPVLTANPEALLSITRLLCEKLRAASAIVEDNTLEMRSRAAKGLLRLAQRHGKVGNDGILVDLVLSQQDLGNYLGISRENVSRQLRQLRFANVIRVDEGHIIITDKIGLGEIAEDVAN